MENEKIPRLKKYKLNARAYKLFSDVIYGTSHLCHKVQIIIQKNTKFMRKLETKNEEEDKV